MKENKLMELSMDFSVDIINLVKHLKSSHKSIISNQYTEKLCGNIRRLLIASCKTAKENAK